MLITRKPLLCLDTNGSIDIGVVKNLKCTGESLAELLEESSKDGKYQSEQSVESCPARRTSV